jgi:twitching motility protein PilT
LVFATLHTNSAAQSIDRMIDVFPPHQQPQVRAQLANILMAICSQRLVPAIGGGRVVAVDQVTGAEVWDDPDAVA